MTLTLDRPATLDLVDAIADTFVERPPAWAAARGVNGLLEVTELERGPVWTIGRRRIERALERMGSQEALRNLEPDAPSRRLVRKMRTRLEPGRLVTPHLANVAVQVAIFGELDYS